MTSAVTDGVVRRRAPAKVNLTLAVHGRRPDGYHEIESWVVPVELYDELRLKPAAGFSLSVGGAQSGVRDDASNLVWQAAAALAEAANRDLAGVVELEKHIPVNAGLGGGSSDAAACLLGLNALWNLDWPIERLIPIAAGLGSDVPLFLTPGQAVIRGRGERVERLASGWGGWLVLVVPSYGVSTASAYGRWTDTGARPEPRSDTRVWAQPPGTADVLSARLFNDLEPAAFACEPRLAGLHSALDGLGGRVVRMTGSGSCLFSLFDSRTEAEAWGREALPRLDEGDTIHVVSTV